MAKLSIGEKAHRVLRFVMGLRTPGAVSALAKYGFTEADLRSGVSRLNAVVAVRLKPEVAGPKPKLIAALDAFEGEWFAVAQATLKHAHPEVGAWLFAGLPASRGLDVAMAVQTFIARVEALELGANPFGEKGGAARALLAARGLTAVRIEEAKATSDAVATLVVEAQAPSDSLEAAEKEMWGWYLEWSAIARMAIKERYILRALGFRRSQRPDDLQGDGDDATSDAPTGDDETVPSLPTRASSPDDTRQSTTS